MSTIFDGGAGILQVGVEGGAVPADVADLGLGGVRSTATSEPLVPCHASCMDAAHEARPDDADSMIRHDARNSLICSHSPATAVPITSPSGGAVRSASFPILRPIPSGRPTPAIRAGVALAAGQPWSKETPAYSQRQLEVVVEVARSS